MVCLICRRRRHSIRAYCCNLESENIARFSPGAIVRRPRTNTNNNIRIPRTNILCPRSSINMCKLRGQSHMYFLRIFPRSCSGPIESYRRETGIYSNESTAHFTQTLTQSYKTSAGAAQMHSSVWLYSFSASLFEVLLN